MSNPIPSCLDLAGILWLHYVFFNYVFLNLFIWLLYELNLADVFSSKICYVWRHSLVYWWDYLSFILPFDERYILWRYNVDIECFQRINFWLFDNLIRKEWNWWLHLLIVFIRRYNKMTWPLWNIALWSFYWLASF